ncbi:hypothetical protein [Actinopolymorpha pittospori]
MWGNRPTVTGLAVSTTTVMALGVGSVALVGGQSALGADTQGAARGAQQPQQAPAAKAAPGGVRAEPGGGHGWGKASRVLHGEFVVPKRGGGYETVRIQRGSLQSASSTEITLRSADGYRQTYRLGSDTVVNAGSAGLRSIGRGDMVSVAATVSGRSATALYVADISHLRSAFEKHAPSSPDHSGMGGAGD